MRIEHLNFSYKEKVIFQNFSAEFSDTGITLITAPSGRGKTTLLYLLAGLLKPDNGTLETPAPQDTAILFQENRLFPGFSAKEQISAVLPHDSDAGYWLKNVNLEQEADTPVEKLSGGMQRRISLARCLAYGADKKLILLDEPFTGMDAELINCLFCLIRKIKVPVIIASHDPRSLNLADQVIKL